MARKLKIEKDPENEVPVVVFEQAIVDLERGFKKLMEGNLTKRAIVLLVQDAAGTGYVSKVQVEAVLKAASSLASIYLVKKK